MGDTKEKDGQGTGKHPHQSAAEPYPHTKDAEKEGEKKSGSEDRKGGKK